MPELVEVKLASPGRGDLFVGGMCVGGPMYAVDANGMANDLRKAIRSVIRATREECCKAVCGDCYEGNKPWRSLDGRKWRHSHAGDTMHFSCTASPIRERMAESEGQEGGGA